MLPPSTIDTACKDFTQYPAYGITTSDDGNAINHILIAGDNLPIMQSLSDHGINGINAIYIDPPYNTGTHAFNYEDHYGSHDQWVDFMRPRLMLAHHMLADTGIIFISIDDHEQPYLRILMNEIFGEDNFIGECVRKTKTTTNDTANGFNQQHDYLVIYGKSKASKLIGRPKDMSAYKNPDNDPRGAWKASDSSANRGRPELNYFPITNPYTGQVDYPPHGSYWRFSINTMQRHIDNGDIVFNTTIRNGRRGFIYKRHANDIRNRYQSMNSLDGISPCFMNMQGRKDLRSVIDSVFSYPKSVDFIAYIMSFMPKDALIMDFFAGSGTTGQAIAEMNHEDGGTRQIIMITDEGGNDVARSITSSRMRKVLSGNGWHDGKQHPCLHQNLIYYSYGE